jgi:dihydrofolate reductase
MHVFLIAAMSADGYIAKDLTAPSTTWTSKEDKLLFTELTERAGVLVMGRKTFETFGRPLKNRKIIVLSSQAKPDVYAHIPNEQLEYRTATPTEVIAQLENEGCAEVAICGGTQIYSSFLNAGLIDTLYITVEPYFFGEGNPLWQATKPSIPLSVELKNMRKLNDSGTLFFEYSVQHAA